MYDELVKQRNVLLSELKTLGDSAKDWTEEQEAQFDAKTAEVEKLNAKIAKLSKVQGIANTPSAAPVATFAGNSIEVGDDLEGKKPFAHFGEQLAAIRLAGMPGGNVDKRLLFGATGNNTVVDSEGGYAVQQDFAGEIMTRAIEEDDIASRCQRISVNGDGLRFYRPKNNTDANNSLFGVRVYRVAQAETVAASKLELEPAEIRLSKLMGIWYVTDEAQSDARALEGMARTGFAASMALKLGDEIINGNGAGECLGVLNAPVTISVAAEGGQAADTVIYDNVRKMKHRLIPGSMQRAAWFVNVDTPEQLEQMNMPIGTGGVPVFLPAGGLSADGFSALYGRPVIPTTHAPALGNVGDIGLYDFSRYLLIDKAGEGVKEDMSMHVRFLYGENTFRWTWRINGMPVDGSAFTFKNSTNTRSPFVTLAAR